MSGGADRTEPSSQGAMRNAPSVILPSKWKLWFYGLATIAIWVLISVFQIWHGWWWIGADGHRLSVAYVGTWAPGRMVLDGDGADIYDPQAVAVVEAKALSDDSIRLPWLYPPSFVPVAALLAYLPVLWSCFVWLALTGLGYIAAIRAILRYRLAVVLALAAPAAYFNVNQTETGFATAGLIGATLVLLPARPILAGIMLGCLTFKPQFGPLFPIILMATGQWRAFGAAAATTLALAGVVLIWPGPEIWQGFLAAIPRIIATTTADQTAGAGGAVSWLDMQSWYSVIRCLGLSAGLAWGLYAAITGILAFVLIRLWRGPAAYPWKAAALAIGCFLATPYVLVYDATISVVAVAFVIKAGLDHGFRRGDIAVCAGMLAAPMSPLFLHGTIPLLPFAFTGFLGWIVCRAAGGLTRR